MKNLFKTSILCIVVLASSCKKETLTPDDPADGGNGNTNLPGSFITAEVGSFPYNSTSGGGQTFATKTAIPFAGNQIAIASALTDTKTLNLTFFAPAATGEVDGVLFYSTDGTSANSIGNDDNCSDVSCSVNVTFNDGKTLEGTFNAVLKKSDCTGPTTSVVGGTFKAVVEQ